MLIHFKRPYLHRGFRLY